MADEMAYAQALKSTLSIRTGPGSMTANLSSPILKSALSMRTGPLRQLCQTYAIQLKSALPMQTGPSTPNMRDGVNDLNPPCLHGQGRGMNAKELRNAILKSALSIRTGPFLWRFPPP